MLKTIQSKRRLFKYWRVLFAVLAALFAHSYWLPLVGRFLIVADSLQPADAIVPLGGEAAKERLAGAALLYQEGYAPSFVIVNVHMTVVGIREEYEALARREAIWQGVDAEDIWVAPGRVSSTVDEAWAVRALAETKGWHSVIVVTSPYHTRRTRLIFREVLQETDIRVDVQPLAGHWYEADSWWRSGRGLQTTWTEYLKLGVFLLGYR